MAYVEPVQWFSQFGKLCSQFFIPPYLEIQNAR